MSLIDLCDTIHNEVDKITYKVEFLQKERDEAIAAREKAIAARDSAFNERDAAFANLAEAHSRMDEMIVEIDDLEDKNTELSLEAEDLIIHKQALQEIRIERNNLHKELSSTLKENAHVLNERNKFVELAAKLRKELDELKFNYDNMEFHLTKAASYRKKSAGGSGSGSSASAISFPYECEEDVEVVSLPPLKKIKTEDK